MKLLFVWTGVTSYMADCWRTLQREADVELKIVIERVESGKEFKAAEVLRDLDVELVSQEQIADAPGGELALRVLSDDGWRPDVIFAVGWHSRIVRQVVTRPAWRDVPKVCCFDLPWRWMFRCFAAKFALWPFLRNYAAAYVPGRACATYARWLGFRKIHKGLFSIDTRKFANVRNVGNRTGFMYVGRMSPEKRVDLIERAYARYRELGGTWRIDYYGGANFRSPEEMPLLYGEHACLVLASAFDPWPLVALEAKASGCEVILSGRCGDRYELEARVAPFGNVEAIARQMLDVERTGAPKTPQDVSQWDCVTWAKRTLEIAEELRKAGRA